MLKTIFFLATIAAPVIAGNWYVAAYGDIDNTNQDSNLTHIAPITNFTECVAAGYPVLESYPEQCRTAEGLLFTNLNKIIQPDTANVADAVAAVRVHAAKDFGIAPDFIAVTSVTKAEWPDGCLGLAGGDQGCIMMITSGYEIIVAANEHNAVYRTDQTGAVVKKAYHR